MSETNHIDPIPLKAGLDSKCLRDAETTISVFCALLATWLTAIYCVSRVGFDNPILPPLKVLAASLFLLFAPHLFHFLSTRFKYQFAPTWLISKASFSLAGLLILLGLGRLSSVTGIDFGLGLVIIGPLLFFAVLLSWVKDGSRRQNLLLILSAGLFSIWLAGVLWNSTARTPLFFESMLVSAPNQDTMYHATIASMIQTY